MVVGADGDSADVTFVAAKAVSPAIRQCLPQDIFGDWNARLTYLHSDVQCLDGEEQAALRIFFEHSSRFHRQLTRESTAGFTGLLFGSVTFRFGRRPRSNRFQLTCFGYHFCSNCISFSSTT